MADTPRTLSQLQSIFRDNNAGDISAQDLRDFLVTALGVYGSITVADGSTEQVDPYTGAKLTAFTNNGASHGTTPDHTDDSITINVAGIYDISAQLSFSGTSSSTVAFRLRVNGSETTPVFGCTRKLGTAGDVGSASFLAPGVSLSENDVLTIYVEMDGATDDLTVVDAQFTVKMVG